MLSFGPPGIFRPGAIRSLPLTYLFGQYKGSPFLLDIHSKKLLIVFAAQITMSLFDQGNHELV